MNNKKYLEEVEEMKGTIHTSFNEVEKVTIQAQEEIE
jgi:hypothetical protein